MLDDVQVRDPGEAAPVRPPVEPVTPRREPVLGRWAALLVAAASGGLLLVSFPPYDLWWLAPVGVAALSLAVHRRRVVAGLLFGAISGACLFVPLLTWTNLHVGQFPWLILSALEVLYIAALGGALAAVSRVVDTWRWSFAPVVGALWVAEEALRDRTPFGGFPWGRLAFSQGDSPLLNLAAYGGAPLVTFAVALAGGLLAAAVVAGRRPVSAVVPAVAVLALFGFSFLVPVASATGPSVRVAVVQGNVPRLGLDFNAQRRAVLDNHVDGTLELAARVAAGTEPRPDLVVWPENASDIDPLANPDAKAAISTAAAAIDAPILVGGLVDTPDGKNILNVTIAWDPDLGPVARYVKRHPVPFAEYVPMRSVARFFSDKVDLVRRDFLPGDEVGVLRLGPVAAGATICFEVAYDDLVRDSVRAGAQLLVVQTNNATFDEAEARQQLAMVRLRAVEHGRPALMASTVGVSGFVTTSGEVLDATGFNVAEVISRDMALGTARTMATSLGPGPEIALVAGAVAARGAAWRVRANRRRATATTPPHHTSSAPRGGAEEG